VTNAATFYNAFMYKKKVHEHGIQYFLHDMNCTQPDNKPNKIKL